MSNKRTAIDPSEAHVLVVEDNVPNFVLIARMLGFLHGMARALVGTMVDVARGHLSFDEFLRIIDARDRSAAGMSAPAQGLVLDSVLY